MIAKKPSEPFMVDRLTAALLKLGQDAAIPIAGIPTALMVSDDRSYMLHQSRVVFAGAVGSVFPVIVGALRELGRLKPSVQSAFLLVLIHQMDFLSR
jgi:hypothetical protein